MARILCSTRLLRVLLSLVMLCACLSLPPGGAATAAGPALSLDNEGGISGVVTIMDTDTPISGAVVNLNTSYFGGVDSTTTAADGSYSFDTVTPGYYVISASADGYGSMYYDAGGNNGYDDAHLELVEVKANTTTTGIDVALPVEATISGCVYQEDGATPIASAGITAHPQRGGATQNAVAGADGCYEIGGFATGDYLIFASAPGRQQIYYNQKLSWNTATALSLVSGQETPGINFRLPLAGSISGTILKADGSVIADQRIVVDAIGTTPDTSTVRADASRTDGTYTIDGLAPGIYKVSVSVQYAPGLVAEYYPNQRLYDSAESIVVRASENVPGIDFDLEQEATIIGRLVDQDSGDPINVDYAYAYAYDLDLNYRGYGIVVPDGTFTIYGVEPGDYYVRFRVPGYGRVFYDGVLDPADGAVVTTTAAGVDLGDIEMAPGITQSGHIYAEDGVTPLEGATVVLTTTYYEWFGWPTNTDANGAYSLSDLPVGDYILQASAQGYATQFYAAGDDWAGATPFSITGDNPPDIDLSLDPAGTISGTVLGEDGQPILDATINVSAIGITNGSHDVQAEVGDDGSYTLSGLRPGAYEILANSSYTAAYSSLYYDNQPLKADATAFVISQDFMTYTDVDFTLSRTEYTFTDETLAAALTYTDPGTPGVETQVEIPVGAGDQPTLFVYTPTDLSETRAGFSFAGIGFTINAYQNGAYQEGFEFLQPTRIELHYNAANLGGVAEEDLRLLFYNADILEWEDAACGAYERHPDEDWLAVDICHLSDFGLFEFIYKAFLPFTRRAP